MKRALAAVAAVAAATTLAGAAPASPGRVQRGCTVPRLYTLTVAAAAARLAASGCRLGRISYERPRMHVARVTGQVPMQGALLPRSVRVSLVVS